MIDIEVRNQKIKVMVSHTGVFYCDYDDQRYEATTLEELKGKLMKATKKKVQIPFARWFDEEHIHWPKGTKSAGIRRGVIVGRHGANGNMLVRWDGEKQTKQEPSWSHQSAKYLQLSPVEEKSYTAAKIGLIEIQKQITEFEKLHSIDIGKLDQGDGD